MAWNGTELGQDRKRKGGTETQKQEREQKQKQKHSPFRETNGFDYTLTATEEMAGAYACRFGLTGRLWLWSWLWLWWLDSW